MYKEHILEKPHTHDKAIEMLTMLSGVKHAVISGVCLLWNNGLENVLDQFYEQTIVEFDSLSPGTPGTPRPMARYTQRLSRPTYSRMSPSTRQVPMVFRARVAC